MMLVAELVSETLHYLDHLTWLSGQEHPIEAFKIMSPYQLLNNYRRLKGVVCFLVLLIPEYGGSMFL
jgi:hypothetical protein